MAGTEGADDETSFDEAFVVAADYHEQAAAERAARDQRIHRDHDARTTWRQAADVPDHEASRSRRPASLRHRTALALVCAAVAAAVFAGQSGRLFPAGERARHAGGDGFSLLTNSQAPPAPRHRNSRRVLPAPVVPETGTSYRFLRTRPGGSSPVTWNPCEPIHYVTRPDREIAGGRSLVTAAFAQLSAATGLGFIDDGSTSESPSDTRAAYQPARYGKRWAPVLLGWSDPTESPRLRGAVAGFGGPSSWRRTGRPEHYVSGQVVLDATQLAAYPNAAFPARGRSEVQDIIEHELGHLIGLGHVEDPTQLMNATTTSASPPGYADGDRHGLALLGRGTCSG